MNAQKIKNEHNVFMKGNMNCAKSERAHNDATKCFIKYTLSLLKCCVSMSISLAHDLSFSLVPVSFKLQY